MGLGDFRTISLIGCYYKIIAKLLAERVKRVVGNEVGEVQNAFIKGRYILDGVLIANDTMDYLKKKKEKDVCLRSGNMSILVNGSPTEEFGLEGGLDKATHYHLFLFILATEGLNAIVSETVENGIFSGVKVGANKVTVSHLQYTDDTIFFGEWNDENAKSLMCILKCFEEVSGLRVNYNKSKLYGIGVSEGELTYMINWMGCGVGEFPFTYMGLPIGENMRNINAWNLGGKQNFLGQMGYGSSFTRERGLNIASLRGKKLALLSKWWWRFRKEKGSLWVRVIKSIYDGSGVLDEYREIGGRVKVDGRDIKFWADRWVDGQRHCDSFSRGGVCKELDDLVDALQNVVISNNCRDRWKWTIFDNGEFKDKDLSRMVGEKILHVESGGQETIRNKLVPKKVNIFVWRPLKGCLPVREELDKRGLDSMLCPSYNNMVESCAHCLVECDLARSVWDKVFRW
nr:reverse transcriptase domain, reverse transcriptase zinc-binding domain protein [Tanacetum cinerariifolium]